MSAVLDARMRPEARPYVEAFERLSRSEPEWLGGARHEAIARFAEAGFPSRRGESWRYLDLRALEENPLPPAVRSDTEAARKLLADSGLQATAFRLVLVDGRFSPDLSAIGELPQGVWLGPLSAALRERDGLVREALRRADEAGQPFASLNTALFSDGFVLDVAAGVSLARPIEIVNLATGCEASSLHTRNIVALGAGSRATIIETHVGVGRYWRNDVVELRLAENAELHRVVIVEEAAEAIHLGFTGGCLEAGAQLHDFALLLAGRAVRHEVEIALIGEGAHCGLDGAFIVSGRDQANIVTMVDHRVPHGTTRELVKGVGAGRGQGAFQGRIIVRPGAQKTDAQQTSRNLIIGDRAVIDTKPELEIYADDVKCAHGATVGDLDATALFYLRSRGIPEEEARRLLIEGFAREAVEQVAHPELREHLLRRLGRRLETLEA